MFAITHTHNHLKNPSSSPVVQDSEPRVDETGQCQSGGSARNSYNINNAQNSSGASRLSQPAYPEFDHRAPVATSSTHTSHPRAPQSNMNINLDPSQKHTLGSVASSRPSSIQFWAGAVQYTREAYNNIPVSGFGQTSSPNSLMSYPDSHNGGKPEPGYENTSALSQHKRKTMLLNTTTTTTTTTVSVDVDVDVAGDFQSPNPPFSGASPHPPQSLPSQLNELTLNNTKTSASIHYQGIVAHHHEHDSHLRNRDNSNNHIRFPAASTAAAAVLEVNSSCKDHNIVGDRHRRVVNPVPMAENTVRGVESGSNQSRYHLNYGKLPGGIPFDGGDISEGDRNYGSTSTTNLYTNLAPTPRVGMDSKVQSGGYSKSTIAALTAGSSSVRATEVQPPGERHGTVVDCAQDPNRSWDPDPRVAAEHDYNTNNRSIYRNSAPSNAQNRWLGLMQFQDDERRRAEEILREEEEEKAERLRNEKKRFTGGRDNMGRLGASSAIPEMPDLEPPPPPQYSSIAKPGEIGLRVGSVHNMYVHELETEYNSVRRHTVPKPAQHQGHGQHLANGNVNNGRGSYHENSATIATTRTAGTGTSTASSTRNVAGSAAICEPAIALSAMDLVPTTIFTPLHYRSHHDGGSNYTTASQRTVSLVSSSSSSYTRSANEGSRVSAVGRGVQSMHPTSSRFHSSDPDVYYELPGESAGTSRNGSTSGDRRIGYWG